MPVGVNMSVSGVFLSSLWPWDHPGWPRLSSKSAGMGSKELKKLKYKLAKKVTVGLQPAFKNINTVCSSKVLQQALPELQPMKKMPLKY